MSGKNGGAPASALAPYGGAFAGLYDKNVGRDYPYDRYARYVDGLIRSRGRASGNNIVADLGCGSGVFTVALARLGRSMIGIDSSDAMLNIAIDRASDAGLDILFLMQDMTAFELFGTVGAITSTIDAMNYITTLRKLRRVFLLASNYLEPGGLFIFDVNAALRYRNELAGRAFMAEYPDGSETAAAYWRTFFDARRRIATTDVTVYERRADGAYERQLERHRQRCHSPEEIRAAAAEAGLLSVGAYGFLTKRPFDADDSKISYVFMKPASIRPAALSG